jgi:peptidoglycan/xylan/chitin deacetylase (PgdA/CDA1 family)
MIMKNSINKCLLTFDVEEWFQVENLKGAVSKEEWENKKSSVVKNTEKILTILSSYQIKATFFILGWVAERNPELIENIKNSCHLLNLI